VAALPLRLALQAERQVGQKADLADMMQTGGGDQAARPASGWEGETSFIHPACPARLSSPWGLIDQPRPCAGDPVARGENERGLLKTLMRRDRLDRFLAQRQFLDMNQMAIESCARAGLLVIGPIDPPVPAE